MRALLAVFAVSLCAVSVRAEDWASWRGPSGNGSTGEAIRIPSKPPKVLWNNKTGKSYTTVAVRGKNVFTMGDDASKNMETVWCYDADTGKVRWRYDYSHPKRDREEARADPNISASTSTPVEFENRLYTLSREGLALCFEVTTGKLLWKKEMTKETGSTLPQFGFAGAALISGGLAIYNVGESGAALNRKTGALVWKSRPYPAAYSTPVAYTQNKTACVAIFNTKGLQGVEAATGKRLWIHFWETPYNVNASDPVISGSRFFITAYGKAQMLDVSNNKVTVAFDVRDMQNTFVTPILVGDYMYGNSKGFLRCVDWKTGQSVWDTRGMGSGALIVAGGDVVALTEQGEVLIVAASPAKYMEKARFKVLEGGCWAQPVLANGRLYCRNTEGELVCLDMRGGK